MASQQPSFKCSICLDDFTDPVSTPCGHNFCKPCINSYWDETHNIQCPLCQQEFKKKPKLLVNVMLRELIELISAKGQSGKEEEAQAQEILCDVCNGQNKGAAVKSCLHCEESLCLEHLKPHQEDAELKMHELLNPISKLKERVCRQHKTPLQLVCHHDLTCVCMMCIKSNHENHKCIPLKNRLRKKKAQVELELSEVQQGINQRNEMARKVAGSGEINANNAATDITDTLRIFNHLQQVIKLNESGLVTALIVLQRKAENRSDCIKGKLLEEVKALEKRKTELDQLSNQEDDLQFLQSFNSLSDPPNTENWPEISAYSDAGVGTVRSALNKLLIVLQSEVSDEVKGLVENEIKRIQQYAVDVTLDSDTANNLLILSKDGKQVTNGTIPQDVPTNPKRFDTLLGVLGKEGYSSGAFYFEVQVQSKSSWDIGVALESVNRKGQTDVCLASGFVVLMLRDGKILKACDQPPVGINLPEKPKKIGVFVDHEEGEVCFYDVGNVTHIYSFTHNRFPKKKLHPYFNPCAQHEGNNSAPMILTPVS